MIFLNYRRQDEAYAAALLDEHLIRHFGANRVFRAGRSIRAGDNYETAILTALDHCRVFLMLIGPDWPDRFSDRAESWVVREVREAMKRSVPVVPVLLTGATLTESSAIPPDLAELTKNQYLRFDYRNVDQDSHKIAREVAAIAPELAPRSWPRRLFRARREGLHGGR